MKSVLQYITDYIQETDKRVLLFTFLFTALLVYLNYQHQLEKKICFASGSFAADFFGHYLIYGLAFFVPYLVASLLRQTGYIGLNQLTLLILIAPLFFALKVSLNLRFHFSDHTGWNGYWNKIAYWPLLALIITTLLFIIWKLSGNYPGFYGLTTKGFNWKPYFMMLLIMLPLLALASTQADFLQTYPKMKTVEGFANQTPAPWFYILLYQLSYGSDFFTIELFFRGFLMLGFIQLAGKDAILPMACFYCTIHFGKPLGECISSFFGGALLGIVVYNTGSIFGGLVVHLGIAWLMEIGGTIGSWMRD